MDDALSQLTGALQNGMWLLLKMFLLYVALPEALGLIVFGFLLRIRGKKLSAILVGLGLIGLFLFVQFGIPELANADLTKAP